MAFKLVRRYQDYDFFEDGMINVEALVERNHI